MKGRMQMREGSERPDVAGPEARGASGEVLRALSDRLEGIDEEMRETLLTKAFLLLADAHGDLETVLACVEEAAAHALCGDRDDAA